MEVRGVDKLYHEGFANGIIKLVNIEESCDLFFSNVIFKNLMDSKLKNTCCLYSPELDQMTVTVKTHVDIPIFTRNYDKTILYNYYRLIKYVRVYKHCKLVNEYVEILD